MTRAAILAAARAEWHRLRDSGKSPVADPKRYYEGIALLVLGLVKHKRR